MAATQSGIHSDGMELLIFYHRNPNIALRNQLVELHVGLVRKIAHQFSHQCAEPYEDLEQIGYFGLIRAIERFDPNQGYAFRRLPGKRLPTRPKLKLSDAIKN